MTRPTPEALVAAPQNPERLIARVSMDSGGFICVYGVPQYDNAPSFEGLTPYEPSKPADYIRADIHATQLAEVTAERDLALVTAEDGWSRLTHAQDRFAEVMAERDALRATVNDWLEGAQARAVAVEALHQELMEAKAMAENAGSDDYAQGLSDAIDALAVRFGEALAADDAAGGEP